MSEQLSKVDITILNAARTILSEQAKHDYDGSPSEVRAAVKAEEAEAAIFRFLSTAHAYLHIEMTYEQLHNMPRTEPEPEPEPCPFYAIQENPGGGYELVHCDNFEGHDDSHTASDWDGETAWEHPGVEA